MAGRRGRGEGSIERLPSGKWRAVLPGRSKAGRSKSFPTSGEARAWIRANADRKDSPTGTVGDWLTDWLAMHKPDVAAKTYAHDEWRVRKYLLPRLGSVKLRDLDGAHVRRMLAELATAGRSDSERQKAGAVLRKALNAAVAVGKLSASPMAHVRLPTPKRPEKRVLTVGQLRELIRAADARGLGHVFRVWADAGLRPGEMFALRWDDFDLPAGTVSVRRSLDASNHRLKEPKTRRSRRTIPLAGPTLDSLRTAPRTSDVFLPDSGGGMYWDSNFGEDVLKPLAVAAGVPWVTGYTLRHTAATLLIRAGVPIKVVSERLGHEDVSTTLRTYAHVMEGDQARAAAAMGRILDDS